jgi:hypothetical protein
LWRLRHNTGTEAAIEMDRSDDRYLSAPSPQFPEP